MNRPAGAPPASSVVLDASALLAVLRREPGADVVKPHLPGSVISAVNYAEVLQKTLDVGIASDTVLRVMRDLEVHVVDFTTGQAAICAALAKPARGLGISLADRACIALGMLEEMLVLTADRDWQKLKIDAKLKFIR